MSYIDNNLVPTEQVLYRTRKHWIALAVPVVIALFLEIVGVVYEMPVLIILPIVIVAVAYLKWSRVEMVVTNKRVLFKTGIFTYRSREILINKVESISVAQGLGGRFLDYGNLVFRGTGGTPEVFSNIASAMEFKKCAINQMGDKR